MTVESALEQAVTGLAAAGSPAELLGAACVAADAGEAAATALAHGDIAGGPGYLAAVDAFAVVRVELENWVAAPPAHARPTVSVEPVRLRHELRELATSLRDRLGDVHTPDASDAAIEDARRAAADAVRALSGSVRDDADVR
jgi:hypothetical protein